MCPAHGVHGSASRRGHPGAVDVTPLGDDVSVFDDHARRSAAMACGSGETVVGLATEAAEDGQAQIDLDRVLVVLGHLDRLVDESVAHTDLGWALGLPFETAGWEVLLLRYRGEGGNE